MTPSLGVCYYPEHWPEKMWTQDAANMVASGITWVRIGEFAWSKMQPRGGAYEWGWLDRAIATLHAAGLRIVLGTPSCTPPRWMLERFPDMLAHDATGHPRGFGSRRHYCFSHEGYRAAAAEMAAAMGQRYGQDPRIHAWQIDNEYDCHDTVVSFSPAAQNAFQRWLEARYGTIEALNTAWGNVFWSMAYDRFDQITAPNLTVTQANPSHEMAFRRFSSDQVVAFNKAQVDALRPLTDAPLIHNYMGRMVAFDHFDVGADLDIASWDSYPIGFLSDRMDASDDHKAAYLQQGDPDFQAFHHDLYRAVGKGRWWVMEQQPGPVNWAPWNPAPLPGMVRLWSLEAVAHGAEVVSYFRWRQAPFAQEQMHAGLRRPDDAPAAGLAEVETVATDLTHLGDLPQGRAPVALIFDYASCWAWEVLPQGADFDYFMLVFDAYRALRKLGQSVDILPPGADLTGYALVVAPGLATVPDSLKRALAARQMPSLIGPRANAVTEEMTIPVPMPPDLPDLGVTAVRVETLPPGTKRPVQGGGAVHRWVEDLQGDATPVLATTEGASVMARGGPLHYLGGWPDSTLWSRLLRDLLGQAHVAVDPMPEGLRQRDTASHRFLFNYSARTVEFNGRTLPPAGVHWGPKPE